MRNLKLIAGLAAALGLLCSTASAHYYVPRHHAACRAHYVRRVVRIRERRHGHFVRRHGRVIYVRQARCYSARQTPPKAVVAHPAPITHPSPALPLPSLIGVGDVPGCIYGASTDPAAYLQPYGATVLRIVLDPAHGENGQALPCVQAAVSEGYKVALAIDWNNTWTAAQIATYFRQVLGYYAPYAWSVSVGNEQELAQGGVTINGAQYAAVWQTVEPIVASLAPQAIRVAGEISPWGLTFMQQALAAGLPGAQALSIHPYVTVYGMTLAQALTVAQDARLPLWVTEGLVGPGAWAPPNIGSVPVTQMAGVQFASAWLG